MLANGTTLGYKKHGEGGSTYNVLKGCKEIPELGLAKERVENSGLDDELKQYEYGIGDPGEITYKFKYDNTSADSPYRLMRKAAEDNDLLDFEETTKDGTKTHFSGQVDVKRTGGGVNGVIEFELKIALASKLEIVDPSGE